MSKTTQVQVYKHYLNRISELCVVTKRIVGAEPHSEYEVYNIATGKFYNVSMHGKWLSNLRSTQLDLVKEL